MSNEYGITRITCDKCAYTTTDAHTIEVWNDITVTCPKCGAIEGTWELPDGVHKSFMDDEERVWVLPLDHPLTVAHA